MPPTAVRVEFRKGLTLYRNGRSPACIPHLNRVMRFRRADPRMLALCHKMTAEIFARVANLEKYFKHLDKSLKFNPKAYWGQLSAKKSVNHVFRMALHRYTHRRRISASEIFEKLLPDCKYKQLPLVYTIIADVKCFGTTEDQIRSHQLVEAAVHMNPKYLPAHKILMHFEIEKALWQYYLTHPNHDED